MTTRVSDERLAQMIESAKEILHRDWWLVTRELQSRRSLTKEQREALERAAKANEGMARICHAAGKQYETQRHLHDAATLRAMCEPEKEG